MEHNPRKPSQERWVASWLALAAAVLVASDGTGAEHELNRARSIYIPLRFEACEHMSDVTLTVTGDSQVFTLGRRIFMFTYYPERKAVLPEFVEVWIEGVATTPDGGHTIRTNLFVTPERILSSRDELERGPEEFETQLRRHMDVRMPETVVHIKCEDSCTRTVPGSDDQDSESEP